MKPKNKTTNRIKWHYDSKTKEWYTGESVAYANDGYCILKDKMASRNSKAFTLIADYKLYVIGRFYTLTAAKTVAHLLKFGK